MSYVSTQTGRSTPRIRNRFIKIWIAVFCFVLAFGYLSYPTLAHGGVIIDSSYDEHYEWLVQVSPYPVVPGEALITMVVFDINTYELVLDLEGELYLAPPNSPEPCCQPDTHLGPFELTTDPLEFPGDYSTSLQIDQAGDWEVQFRVWATDTDSEGAVERLETAPVIETIVKMRIIEATGSTEPFVVSTVITQNVTDSASETVLSTETVASYPSPFQSPLTNREITQTGISSPSTAPSGVIEGAQWGNVQSILGKRGLWIALSGALIILGIGLVYYRRQRGASLKE